MKIRTLMNKTLTKKAMAEMKRMTTANIAYRLLKIFRNHISKDNEITRGQLFKKIFGRAEEVGFEDEFRWDYVKRAMHLCRQKSRCFIGSRFERGVWRYFVIEDMNDAEYYIMTLHKNIKRMEEMQKKAVRAVKQGWHKENWLDHAQEKLGWDNGQRRIETDKK